MRSISSKWLSLIATTAILLSTLLLVPISNSMSGDSIETAPLMAPGYYPNEAREGFGYYNVTGKVGSNLTAIITYTLPNASKLILRRPNGTQIDMSSTESGVEIVSTICDSNLMYILHVTDPVENCILKNYSFTLTICLDNDCGQSNGGIPGFPVLSAVFGILTLLGVVVLSRRRSSHSI